MTVAVSCRLLCGWWQRLRGLLWTDPSSSGVVLLCPCSSIHTFGMSYPIDVAFLSEDGLAVLVRRSVCPGRILSCRKAELVLERPSSELEWFSEGDRVDLVARGCVTEGKSR